MFLFIWFRNGYSARKMNSKKPGEMPVRTIRNEGSFIDVNEDHYAKYVFSCEGKNVEVSVNGNPVEVVSINGRTSYIAKVTERGCITITVDK